MMEVKSFTFNDYQENTYLIVKDGKCLIIDPGNYYDEENFTIKKFIDDNSLIPEFILITHVHICLLYTSPSPRDAHESRMPSSA